MRALLPLLVLPLVVAGCGAGGAAPAGFGGPRVVSHETENGATPMFVATPAGDRVVAWVSAPGGGPDGSLHVSVTRAGSRRPEPTVTLRDSLGPIQAHGEAPPQLAADSAGRLYALYAVGRMVPGQRFPVSALRFARSDDGGRTWSRPVTINDTGRFGEFGAHDFHALTIGSGGELIATWLDARTGRSGVWLTRSPDGGHTWESNRAIYADSTCPCCRTSVAASPRGELFVAWRAVLPGDVRDVVVMRSPDGGRTWEAPVRPRADGWGYPGCPHAGPSLRLDAVGRVHVAWWTGKDGEAGVYYARSNDGGRTFAAQPISVGERSAPAHVQLAVTSSGAPLVAWDDGLTRLPRVLVRRAARAGGPFGPVAQVSASGVAAGYPVIALAGDSVLVAWSQRTPAAHAAALAARADMRDLGAVMDLPRVGQSEIFVSAGGLRPLAGGGSGD